MTQSLLGGQLNKMFNKLLKWLENHKTALIVVLIVIVVGCLFYKNDEGFYAIETNVDTIYNNMRSLMNKEYLLSKKSDGTDSNKDSSNAKDIRISFNGIETKIDHYLELRILVQNYLNLVARHLYNSPATLAILDEHSDLGLIKGNSSDIMNWGDFAASNDEKVSLLNNALKEKLEEIKEYIEDNKLESENNGSIGKLIDTVNTNLDVSIENNGLFYKDKKAFSWGETYLNMTKINTSFNDIVSKVNFVKSQFIALKEYSDGITGDFPAADASGDKQTLGKRIEKGYVDIVIDTFGSTDKNLKQILNDLIGDNGLGDAKNKGLRKLLTDFVGEEDTTDATNNTGIYKLTYYNDSDNNKRDALGDKLGSTVDSNDKENAGFREKIKDLYDGIKDIKDNYENFEKSIKKIRDPDDEYEDFADYPDYAADDSTDSKTFINAFIGAAITNINTFFTEVNFQEDLDDINGLINRYTREMVYKNTMDECEKLIGGIESNGSANMNGVLNEIFNKIKNETTPNTGHMILSVKQVLENELNGFDTSNFAKSNNFFMLIDMYNHFEDYMASEREIYRKIFEEHLENGYDDETFDDELEKMDTKRTIINGYKNKFLDDNSQYMIALKNLIFNKISENVTTTTQAATTTTEATPTQTTSSNSQGGSSSGTTGVNTASTGQRCIIRGLQGDLNHIISNFSGASYDFKIFGSGESSSSQNSVIMVYQRPIRSGEHTHVFAVDDNGNLVTQPEDSNNAQQRWVLQPISGSSELFEVVSNYNSVSMALNQDSSYLSLKPSGSGYEGSKWRTIFGEPSSGLLSCNPALPHQSVASPDTQVESQYANQLAEIMAMVKRNTDLYQKEVGEQKTASSVFGRGEPLRLKVNLLGSNDGVEGDNFNNVEKFTDNSRNSNNVVGLLDAYEREQNGAPFGEFTANPNNPKCKKVNYDDYTSNRVGQCNCIV